MFNYLCVKMTVNYHYLLKYYHFIWFPDLTKEYIYRRN